MSNLKRAADLVAELRQRLVERYSLRILNCRTQEDFDLMWIRFRKDSEFLVEWERLRALCEIEEIFTARLRVVWTASVQSLSEALQKM